MSKRVETLDEALTNVRLAIAFATASERDAILMHEAVNNLLAAVSRVERDMLTRFEEECYHRMAADDRVRELERQVAGLRPEPVTIRVVNENWSPLTNTEEAPDARA